MILLRRLAYQIAHRWGFIRTLTILNAQAARLLASLAQTNHQHAQAAPNQSFSSNPNA